MADFKSDYQRPKDGFHFQFGGVNTRDVPDAIAPNKYQVAHNVRSTGANSIRTRPGYVSIFSTGGNPITDIRGYATIETDALPRILARDSGGVVWLDTGSSVGNMTGNAGYGASMLPFRPSESPQTWMYIGADGDYQKFSAPNANSVTQYKVGIAEPQKQVESAPNVPYFSDITGGNSSWFLGGTAGSGSPTSAVRSNDVAGVVIADPVIATRFSVQVGNNANAQYQAYETVICGNASTPLVQDVIPSVGLGSNATVAAVYFQSGSSGLCTITPTQVPLPGGTGFAPISGLRRGALVSVGGSILQVLGTEVGPTGQVSFDANSSGGVSVGANVSGVPTIIVAAGSGVSNGTSITAAAITANFNTGIGTVSQNFSASPWATSLAGQLPQQDDYIHVSMSFSDPTQLIQALIMFNLDGGNNQANYNGNLLYYAVRPGDLVGISNGNQSVLSAILQSAENEIIGNLPTPGNISAPAQSSAANNQWAEVLFPISSLTRLGGDQSKTLANCTGVQLQVNVANNISFSFGSLWYGAGFSPDVGNNGAPYSYQVVPLSSTTGVRGNPTPLQRYGVSPRRQSVLVKTSALNNAYDPQIDTWEVYRYGGTISSYRFIGATPVGSDFTDDVFDDAAAAGNALVIDNTEPWPSIDVPWSGSGNAFGPFFVATGSIPSTMNRWLPGSIFQIGGNEAFTLRSRPLVSGNTATFEFEECIGSGAATVFVLEPNVARDTLPYLWGPNEQGYFFGCGDPLRPGVVQWTKAYAPDACPTAYNLDLCPPSEPLLGGEVISGISIVASSKRWWSLYFQPGGTPLYSQVEIPVGKRLASPFGKCTDGARIYFWASDCIAATSGGAGESLTEKDLYNLFPHGGLSGKNVTRLGVTYYAPDYSRAATFRMAVREGLLYAIYQDSTGTNRCIVCNLATGAWGDDGYHDPMSVPYAIEQPSGTLELSPSLYPAVVMGDANGNVWKIQDRTGDNGTGISGAVGTFEWDGGDLRAAYQWGDQYVDVFAPAGMSVTPISQGNNVASATVISANNNRQMAPVSLGGEALEVYIGLSLTWTDFGNNSQNVATTLYAWQPSFAPKPETIQDRFGDWYDFGGASYMRGLVFHADTFGANKNISIRNSDKNSLVQFSGGPANGQINHNGEQEIAYYFPTPFVAHMVRDEPQDLVPWRKFNIEWFKDPWPELSDLRSPWLDLGAQGAKYLRGAVIPMDTNGNAVSLTFFSSDGGNNTVGPFTTVAAEKTAVGWAFTTPLIGHDFQFVPTGPARIWYDEIRWDFDPWPELIPEASAWLNMGTPGDKYLRGAVIPMDTGGNNVSINFISSGGANVSLPANTATNVKTPVPFAFSVPLIGHEFQLVPSANNSVRIWWEEVKWIFDPWPEFTAEASPWMDLGTPGAKYLRGCVIPLDTGGNAVSLSFGSSDGGNNNTVGPFTTTTKEKTAVAFAFTTPLIGHEFQLIPGNNVRVWYPEIKWTFDPWPEFTTEASPWMDLGTPGAKYLRGCVIPMDTGGNAVSLTFLSSDDGNNSVGPFTTTTSEKTAAPFAFTTPLIGHEFQFVPSNNVRVWYEGIKWIFDPWPELTTEASSWMNLGGQGAKYLRGAVIPVDTGGAAVSLTFLSSDGGSVTVGPFTTTASEKTAVPWAFSIPLIGHDFQLIPSGPIRVWYEEIRWDFQPWPELINEATGWLPVLQGGGAAFLQGLILPIETHASTPALSLLTDTGQTIALTATVTPPANVKTGVPYSLATPVICHQVQLLPTKPCRIWLEEIQWVAEPTPELASTWTTQWTGFGSQGYKHIPRIEPSYSATAPVSLIVSSYDGASPATIALPSTGGATQRTTVNLTLNKGSLYRFSATSAAPFQIFQEDCLIWVCEWGRSKSGTPVKLLGGSFGNRARI